MRKLKPNPDARVKASELYSAYRKWCEEAGRLAKSSAKFGIEMAKRFKKEKYDGIMQYIDITLTE